MVLRVRKQKVLLGEVLASLSSQNSASILASSSSSLKGGEDEGTCDKAERATFDIGAATVVFEVDLVRRAITRRKNIFCPTRSFMSTKSCSVISARTDCDVIWCSKTQYRFVK